MKRASIGGLGLIVLLGACDYTTHVRTASRHASLPAPQFTIEYDKRRQRGKLDSIQVYEVTDNTPTLVWKATTETRKRADGIYRFTYGVAPLGMKNDHNPGPLQRNHTYEVCVDNKRIECHRFQVTADGFVRHVERPPDAVEALRKWIE